MNTSANHPHKLKLKAALALFAAALYLAQPTPAIAQLTWDAGGTHASNPSNGNGTWNAVTTNWSNGTSDVTWNSGTAVFGNAAGAGASGGTITLSGSLNASGVTFNSPKFWTISSATNTDLLTITSSGTIANNSTGTVIINSNLAATSGFATTGAAGIQLKGTNTNVAGTVTLQGAAVTAFTSSAFGSAGITINTAAGTGGTAFGDALDINGNGLTIANNISLASTSLAANIGNFSGSNTISGNVTFNRGGSKIYAATGTTLTLSGTFTNNAGNAQSLFLNDPSNTGTLIFNKNGAGTGAASVGAINIQGGTVVASGTNPLGNGTFFIGSSTASATLSVDSITNVASSTTASVTVYGVSTNGLVLGTTAGATSNTGTLIYTGTGETTSRNISLGSTATGSGTNGAVFDQSGTGLLKFTSNLISTGTSTAGGAHLLTFQGSTSGTGEFAGKIVDTTNGTVKTTSVAKAGTGTWVLSGSNTYTGSTTVSAGTLLLASGGVIGNGGVSVNGGEFKVNGSTTSAVSVASGGTVSGSGTIGNLTVSSGGTLSPGNSPGIITTGTLSLASGSVFSAEMTGSNTVAGTNYDQVNVAGTVTLGGTLSLTLTGFTATNGNLYFLINNDGSDAITGAFSNINGGSTSNNTEFTLGGQRWFISYAANYNAGVGSTFTGGNDVALQAIPEPGTWALLAAGLTALVILRRRSPKNS